MYGNVPGGEVARGCLLHVFEQTLRMLHPLMPFITEELWSYLPEREGRESLLAAAAWPIADSAFIDAEAESQFAAVQALVTAVRTVRAEYNVPPGKGIPVSVEPATATTKAALDNELATVQRLAKIDPLTFGGDHDGVGAHAVLPDGSAVFVPLGGTIDVEAECARLAGEMQRLDKQLAGVRAKLTNENFTTRAPAEVVDREREKEKAWSEQSETLAAKRHSLGC